MFGADKKYLSISVNDGVIKVAQASSSGILEKIARGSFSAGSAEEGIKALKSLLGQFNRKLPVICLIPASAATAKIIEVPSSDTEEIKSIINLQAGRHTPYSREEVLISYINLGVNAMNNTRLMMVIVHRDIVKERISIIEGSGLNVEKILFAPEAQGRFYAKALNLKKEASPIGLVDFTQNNASFMILAKSSLAFVRHIPVGIKNITESADAIAKLKEEFVKSMDAFQQEDGNEPPFSYILTGGRDVLNTIAAPFKDELSIEFQINAFSNFVKGSIDAKKKLQSNFDDDSFLDVVSAASSVARCEINLMPDDMILRKTLEVQSQEAIKTIIASVVIMILIFIMVMGNVYFKDTYLQKNLREHFAPQKVEVKLLHEKLDKVNLVHDYIKSRMGSLDVIRGIYSITPDSIYLNNINVDNDGTVTIDGVADSMPIVYSFVKTIGDSNMFKETKLKSTATKRDNDKVVASFEIEFKSSQVASADASKEQA